MTRRIRRRVLVIAAVGTVAAVGVAALATARHDKPGPPVTDAQSALADDARFSTGREAATTVGEIGLLLLSDGRACLARHRAGYRPCEARLAASGYGQVLAISLLHCTQPDVFEARASLGRYLAAIERLDRKPTAEMPSVPAVPNCN